MVWGWILLKQVPEGMRKGVLIAVVSGVTAMHVVIPVYSSTVSSPRQLTAASLSYHDHDHCKYSHNEIYNGYQLLNGAGGGFAMVILRLVLAITFLVGCHRLWIRDNVERNGFLMLFAGLGGLWLLALPLVLLVAELVPPYFQHVAVTIGTLLYQGLGLTMLCVFLLSNTKYYRIVTSMDLVLPRSIAVD
jgi:hypothetical protein